MSYMCVVKQKMHIFINMFKNKIDSYLARADYA